ncbi:MAG: hypothetical protein HQK99_08205 [Nitrospirae bacterium]|nr:hypothetical protein [Nitrospirota bacterium]
MFLKLETNNSDKIRLSIIILASAILLPLLLVVYFTWTGRLEALIEVISNNFAYAKYYSHVSSGLRLMRSGTALTWYILNDITTDIFFLAGVLSAFYADFNKDFRHVPLLLLSWFIFGLISVNMTSTHFGHYYLLLVTPFVAMNASGAVFMSYNLRRDFNFADMTSKIVITVIFIICLLSFDTDTVYQFYGRIIEPYNVRNLQESSLFIKNNTSENDYIWVPVDNKYVYLESERLSPTPYLFVFRHLFIDTFKSKGTDKSKLLLDNLMSKPPKFIVIGTTKGLFEEFNYHVPESVKRWIQDNYHLRVSLNDCIIIENNAFIPHETTSDTGY